MPRGVACPPGREWGCQQVGHPLEGMPTGNDAPAAIKASAAGKQGQEGHRVPCALLVPPLGGFEVPGVPSVPAVPSLLLQFIISGCLSIGAEKSPTECAVSFPGSTLGVIPWGGWGVPLGF